MNIQDNKNLKVKLYQAKLDSIMDPTKLQFSYEYIYLDNLTTRLVEIDKHGNYKPKLADKITLSPDKTEIQFELKEEYFSDGSLITTTDVARSIKRAIIKGVPHSKPKEYILDAEKVTSLDSQIAGIELQSDKLIKLRLKKPIKEIFYYLQLTDFAIYHKNQISKDELQIEDWKVSSGPYTLTNNDGKLQFLRNRFSTLGSLNFKDMESIYRNKIDSNFEIVSGKYATVAYLLLNSSAGIFRDLKNRKIVQNQIFHLSKFEDISAELFTKTYQYFLPGAKGYIDNIQFKVKELNNIDIKSISDKKIKIKSVEGIIKYIPNNFTQSVNKDSGEAFEFDFNHTMNEYRNWLEYRDFDAILMVSSMSYKVLTESLNLLYNSTPPEALDPTGNIKNLLYTYLENFDPNKDEDIIKNILTQMTEDAEIIPIGYLPSGKFYNKKKIDTSDLYLEESMQFWRLRVK